MKHRLSSLVSLGHAILTYGLERDTLVRSLKAALLVGSILGLINHGPALLAGRFTTEQLVPLFITYLVPFSVATYGQIQGKRQRDRTYRQQVVQAD